MEIIDTKIRISLPQQYHCSIQDTSGDRMEVAIAMSVVIVIFMPVIVALILIIKYQQHCGLLEPPAGLSYRVSYILNFNCWFITASL
jgi:hypothetical protein